MTDAKTDSSIAVYSARDLTPLEDFDVVFRNLATGKFHYSPDIYVTLEEAQAEAARLNAEGVVSDHWEKFNPLEEVPKPLCRRSEKHAPTASNDLSHLMPQPGEYVLARFNTDDLVSVLRNLDTQTRDITVSELVCEAGRLDGIEPDKVWLKFSCTSEGFIKSGTENNAELVGLANVTIHVSPEPDQGPGVIAMTIIKQQRGKRTTVAELKPGIDPHMLSLAVPMLFAK